MEHSFHRHGGGCCGIIPPEILETLATSTSEEVTDVQRALAANTLKTMKSVHRVRRELPALGELLASGGGGDQQARLAVLATTADLYEKVAASTTISPFIKKRAEAVLARQAAERVAADIDGADTAAPVRTLFRVVRDAEQRNEQAGPIVATEGVDEASITDEDVLRIYIGLGQVFEFFHKVFGRNSIDDLGYHLFATAHFDDDNGIGNIGFMNAQWNGGTHEWYFGDGDGDIFNDFTLAPDVIAHEYAHAVTQFTANLTYAWQSGAVNEHISDVFGILFKQWSNEDGPVKASESDWLIGAGLFNTPKPSALRSMREPGTAYHWVPIGADRQPPDMDGFVDLPLEDDGGGVHRFSGIPNRVFYTVAIGFEKEFGGFAWEKPGKVWYTTLTDPVLRDTFDLRQFEQDGVFDEAAAIKRLKDAFTPFANLTCKHARRLYGEKAFTIVRDAWVTAKVLKHRS